MDRTAAFVILGSVAGLVVVVLCIAAYAAQSRTRAEEQKLQAALKDGRFSLSPTPSKRESEREPLREEPEAVAIPCAHQKTITFPLVGKV